MTLKPKIWKTSEDGTIDFISLTTEYLEESLEILKNSFIASEYVSVAIGLPGNDAAILELKDLALRIVFDGVSVIAVDRKTNKVCGIAFNKIEVANDPKDAKYYEDYFKKCKESSAKAMLQFMGELEARFNFFEYCKVDCVLEIVFLATHQEFIRKGIARGLCEASIDLSKELAKGNNVKTSVNGEELKLEPKPEVVTAIFTSPYSQKIGRALTWERAFTLSYEEFSHEGKTFSSILGGDQKYMTCEFKRI
nr:uncharacterized protein LOC111507238 [Leptinotarsa decemlineata]